MGTTDQAALRAKRDAVGRKWKRGILAAIVVLGALIVTMAFRQPQFAWAWMVLMVLLVPAVLLTAAVLKYLSLIYLRLRHGGRTVRVPD